MSKEEILNFVNKNRVFYLATLGDNKPRVRAMSLLEADEDRILFGTDIHKDVYRELASNPLIEMCFFSAKEGVQIRITGIVKTIDDKGVKEEIVKTRPFLQPIIEKDGYDGLIVYDVSQAKATKWTLETSYDAKVYIDL